MVDAPLVLPLLTCGLLWCFFAVMAAGALPWLLRGLRRLVPHQRSLCLLGVALYPPLIAAGLSFLVYTPALTGLAVDAHCHDGVCGLHVPVLRASSGLALLTTATLVTTLVVALGCLGDALWRSARMTRLVARLARRADGRDFRLIDSDRLIACCLGILHPTIVISSGLVARADPRQLDVILMHEHAHRYRLDNLRHLLAGVSTLVWPATRRAQLLLELRLAAEQSCDHAVAAAAGDKRVVAGTIDHLRGLQHAEGHPAPDADLFVAARLAALARGDWVSLPRGQAWSALVLLMIVPLAALTYPLHRAFELVVSSL
jgi:Zn-dependent protease with chaperone function